MATFGEEVFDYIYPPYNPYSYQYLSYRPKSCNWRQSHYLNSYADPIEYFDNYQRAQLKAILSQVNPNLTPRMRKANTKDIGVQISPKIDASVQCSLGPRTLTKMTMRKKEVAFKYQASPNQVQGSQASMPKNVRFRRTMAIFSPLVSSNLNTFINKDDQDTRKANSEEPQEKTLPEVKENEEQAATLEQVRSPVETSSTVLDRTDTEKPENTKKKQNNEDVVANTAKNEIRLKFQFLEQKYGYFHCKDCNARWESAYVWSTSSSFAEHAKRHTTLTKSRTSPVKPADRQDAPVPSKCGMLTQRGHIVRTCVAGARVNDSRVTALSASNTSFDFDGIVDFLFKLELMERRK